MNKRLSDLDMRLWSDQLLFVIFLEFCEIISGLDG